MLESLVNNPVLVYVFAGAVLLVAVITLFQEKGKILVTWLLLILAAAILLLAGCAA